MSQEIPYKIFLSENELPKQWYNIRADMKNTPAPLLNPATLKPATAEEAIWGMRMRGLRIRLGICNILVPMPWLMRPLHLFSRKLATAKPTMCAAQPATAAPPAMLMAI